MYFFPLLIPALNAFSGKEKQSVLHGRETFLVKVKGAAFYGKYNRGCTYGRGAKYGTQDGLCDEIM